MVTQKQFITKAESLLNQKVTVPSNPYGGQCVSYLDNLVRWATNNEKNLAYTNAIDLLAKAKSVGLTVVYFTGANYTFEEGDMFVSRSPYHEYGHCGVFKEGGGQPRTLEQNVDGNSDALVNGGWVRQKKRLVYNTKAMAYSDIYEVQTLIGWIKPPVEKSAVVEEVKTESKQSKNRKRSGMYGSFIFTVKEGDGEFAKGAVYLFNAATNKVTGFRTADELTYVSERYKKMFGEDIPSETYSKNVPVYRRIFNGLRTDTSYEGDNASDLRNMLDAISKKVAGSDAAILQIKTLIDNQMTGSELIEKLSSLVKGNDVSTKQTFTALYDINIRKEASIKAEKIGVLRKGQTVDIVGSANSDGYYWISFMNNGSLAYVCSKVEGGEVYGNIV